MQHRPSLRRSILLALSLLSACAAANPGGDSPQAAGASHPPGFAAAYLSARFAAGQGDNDVAAARFLQALAADPANNDLRQQAFIASLLAGRPEALTLAQMMPDDQAALLLLGASDARNGRWEQAETRFAGMPRQGLGLVLQPLLLAWTQAGEGRTDVALATLASSPDAQRFRALFTLHGALIADVGRKSAEAARLYRLAITEFGGTDLTLARHLASWQARQGHADEAQQTLATLLKAAPDLAIIAKGLEATAAERTIRNATDGMAEVFHTIAGALRAQERAAYAPILVRLALDLRPDYAQARMLAADLYDGRDKTDQALAVLGEPARGDALGPLLRMRRAVLLDRRDQTAEALRLLEELARELPDRPEVAIAQADILRSRKRFPEAVAAYDRAVALIPQPPVRANWPLYYTRGIALDRAKQWARAEADFQTALELQPDQPLVMNYLAYSWVEQGRNLAKAREMLERAVQLRPNDGAIADSLGWALFRMNDPRAALKYMERAIELDPNDATITGHLGDVYWALGRKLEAQFLWRRALIQSPEPDEAARLQGKLREAEASR